ncbi:Protein F42G8.10 a, partial [Aphelenchoides avenae]
MLAAGKVRPVALRERTLVQAFRRYAASHGPSNEELEEVERQPNFYRPGSDSYAYENPWPKLNKGRLDWLFQDGWRRPPAKDQGQRMRRQWIWWGQVSHDEHADWLKFHKGAFIAFTFVCGWFGMYICFMLPD